MVTTIKSTSWASSQPFKAVQTCKENSFAMAAPTWLTSTPHLEGCRVGCSWNPSPSTFWLERSWEEICTPASATGTRSGWRWLLSKGQASKGSIAQDVSVGWDFVSLQAVKIFCLVVVDMTSTSCAGPNTIGAKSTVMTVTAQKNVVGKAADFFSSVPADSAAFHE